MSYCFKQDNQETYNMTTWTIWRDVTSFAGSHVVFCTAPAKLMLTSRSDCFLGGFVADITNQNILADLGVPLEEQIRVIRNLTHLHNEAKDIGIVVQHDTARHIGIKGTGGITHDARRKVSLNLAKEFLVNDHLLGREFLEQCDELEMFSSS